MLTRTLCAALGFVVACGGSGDTDSAAGPGTSTGGGDETTAVMPTSSGGASGEETSGGAGGSSGGATSGGESTTQGAGSTGSDSGAADCMGVDATFTAVLAGPLSGCSGFEPPCHNAGAGGLFIDTADPVMTRAALVDVTATAPDAGERVVPGDPARSFLYRKLIDDLPGPNDGGPMPAPGGLMGSMWMELPQDQLDAVRCWILAGALAD